MESLDINGQEETTVLIVMPTYNEGESIRQIVRRARTAVPTAHILIIDDASPDGTGDIADEIAHSDAHVKVIHRDAKEGLGTAYRTGFLWAIKQRYDVVVEMDADGSHRPEDLPRLLHVLLETDLVLGSRWVNGGEVINWSRHRIVLSRFANWYARRLLRLAVLDVTAGYRAYRRPALEAININTVTSEGYAFQIELTNRVAAAGFSIAEVPIQFVEREHGKSKMDYAVIVEAIRSVLSWRLRGNK